MNLTQKKCVPCEGGTKPLEGEELKTYMSYLKTPWELVNNLRIKKEFKFKDFKEAIAFVNKIAAIAEEEGHHPDMYIFYNRVSIELTTHAISGLSVNDFILAKKVEDIAK